MINSIKEYADKSYISFHTPCHMGRNKLLNSVLDSSYDLTELSETDNLFKENGIIKEMEERFSKRYGGEFFYPLVNGATSGVMAALGTFNEGDCILIDRNCHISVVNAVKQHRLNPVFIETDFNKFGILNPPLLNSVKKAYTENKDVKGIFLTNPNYYGMSVDLKSILKFAKEKNIISIVDEAHGTHYYYIDKTKTATYLGADIAILSFHKNLPSLTQTGGILIRNLALKDKIKENLRLYTSTSPSYLFMMGIEAMDEFMQKEGSLIINERYSYLKKVKENLYKSGVNILLDNDPFKFVVNVDDAYGKEKTLKDKYKIVPEMCDEDNITFIISIHNYKKEIELLTKALKDVAKCLNKNNKSFILPKKNMTPYEATKKEKAVYKLKDAIGKTAGETVIEFPPSVPIIVEGEVINECAVRLIKKKEIKCVRE